MFKVWVVRSREENDDGDYDFYQSFCDKEDAFRCRDTYNMAIGLDEKDSGPLVIEYGGKLFGYSREDQ